MRVKEAHFSLAKTINMGNYESLRVEVGVTVDFSEEEPCSPERFNELANGVRERLKDQIHRTIEDAR